MIWLEQWRAIAARIDGLVTAGEFLGSVFTLNSADQFRVVPKAILPEFQSITRELEQFGRLHGKDLPQPAAEALRQYLNQRWESQFSSLPNSGAGNLQALAPLVSFRSQFEYLVRDAEAEGRSRTELAFEHLRRQLVVDDQVRAKWVEAFRGHETACEKLGAVHLLSHGIWAFKVHGPREATDLVFGDPVAKYEDLIRRTARAIVLTEWKLVKTPGETSRKAEEARVEAGLYSGGVLADIELKLTRFVVLVSWEDQPPPADVDVGAVCYRHVVLPLNAMTPSKAARRGRRRAG